MKSPPTPQPHQSQQVLFPAAITIRTDQSTREAFQAACRSSGTTMQNATAMFMEATIAHHTDRSIRHLDGSLCPIAALIEALAASVRFEVTNRPNPPRPQ